MEEATGAEIHNTATGNASSRIVQVGWIEHATFAEQPVGEGEVPFWATSEGGHGRYPGDPVRLTVAGKSRHIVLLRAFTPVVLDRPDGLPAYDVKAKAKAFEPIRIFDVALEGEPEATGLDGARFPFSVHVGELEVFELRPSHTERVAWAVDVSWTFMGRTGTTRVMREDGTPFVCAPQRGAERGV